MTNIIEEHVTGKKITLPKTEEVELSFADQTIVQLGFGERAKVMTMAKSASRETRLNGYDKFAQDLNHDAFLVLGAAYYGIAVTDGLTPTQATKLCEGECLNSLFDYNLSMVDVQTAGMAVLELSGMKELLKLEGDDSFIEEDDEEETEDDSDITSQY